MTLQPEALRWADILESYHFRLGRLDATGAAAELRRLHALNQELLEALRELVEEATDVWEYGSDYPHIEKARAAIARVECKNDN